MRQPDRTAHGRWVRDRHRSLTLPPETDGRLTLSQLQTYVEAVILIDLIAWGAPSDH